MKKIFRIAEKWIVFFIFLSKSVISNAEEIKANLETTPFPAQERESTSPQTSNLTPLPATSSETTSIPEKNEYAGFISPYFRFGPTLAINVPEIIVYGIEFRAIGGFGGGISIGSLPQISYQEYSAHSSSFDLKLRYFPFPESFFVGLNFGSQDLTVSRSGSVSVSYLGMSLPWKIPYTASIHLSTMAFTPNLGWFVIFDKGFTLGFEIGCKILFNFKSDLNATTTAENQILAEIAKQQKEYKDAQAQIEDILSTIKNTPIPYVTLLKVGYLF